MTFRFLGIGRLSFPTRLFIAMAFVGAVVVGHDSLNTTARAQSAVPPPTADAAKSAKQAATPSGTASAEAKAAAPTKKTQAELEADLAKLLSGATLEGSFNTTGPARDGARLSADKYTLGDVRKLAGNQWMIQYTFRDSVIPLPLTIEWAGDTPVIIVDNRTILGQGPYSARVMFFADHYSGYWKHGERGGSMFGVVHRAGATPAAAGPATAPATPSSTDGKSKQ